MIEVEGLVKSFRLNRKQQEAEGLPTPEVRAVDDVSFTCQPGRVYSLLGPNGAGKTTTLRIIATILKPTSGTVRVGGVNVEDDPTAVRRNLGFLTGSTGLYDRLTPNELVKYFADLNAVPSDTFKHRKDELFTLLDIHGFAQKRIGKLSTGMRQKVSIARTMIHDPEVVVFDEPTAGLDVITANSIIDLIKRCRNDGKTVLFSTHIMGEVELLSDDIGIIHKGKMVYEGRFDALKHEMQSGSLVEEFIRIVNAA